MKSFTAVIFGCALIGAVSASLSTAPGHFNDLRRRLGHMKDGLKDEAGNEDNTFADMYKIYATAFVLPNHKERSHDDYRNYAPSGDECMVFLRKFRIDSYTLNDIEELVVLDACLGYLYESGHHEEDKAASVTLNRDLQDFIEDETLKSIYQGTGLESFDDKSKKCVANLLVSSIEAKKQFTDVVCNNHWLNIFNKFAACQDNMYDRAREEDSYAKFIYELVRRRANECFDNEINLLNQEIRKNYRNNPFSMIANKVSYWDQLKKQRGERFYPPMLATVLKALQGTETQINIREIADIIRGIALKSPTFTNRLLRNMAKYADNNIKPNSWHLKKASRGADDPTGVQRYDTLIDDMCNFFRRSDSENFYDFVTPFTRMVTMLKYPQIFGISRQDFVEKVLTHSFETGALYLAVSGCNILTFTEGQFIRVPQNHELHYKVVFKHNTASMVQWPDVGYY